MLLVLERLRRVASSLDASRDAAAVLIRLAFGYHLVQYTYDEVLFLNAHVGIGAWLAQLGVPFPEVMAYVAMGAELFGGLLWIVGLWVRPAALVLVINFITAICLVHLDDPYAKRFEAIQMLVVACFLLWHGGGRLSLDHWLAARRRRSGGATVAA